MAWPDRLCGLVVRVLGYRSGGPGPIPGTTKRKNVVGSGTGSTQPHEYNWGATWWKSSGSCLENREYGRRDLSHGTLYPQKLAITLPTSGSRLVGIVRSQTQTMEFFLWHDLPYVWHLVLNYNVLQLAMLLSKMTLFQHPLSHFL
jgi:hypothetical protein